MAPDHARFCVAVVKPVAPGREYVFETYVDGRYTGYVGGSAEKINLNEGFVAVEELPNREDDDGTMYIHPFIFQPWNPGEDEEDVESDFADAQADAFYDKVLDADREFGTIDVVFSNPLKNRPPRNYRGPRQSAAKSRVGDFVVAVASYGIEPMLHGVSTKDAAGMRINFGYHRFFYRSIEWMEKAGLFDRVFDDVTVGAVNESGDQATRPLPATSASIPNSIAAEMAPGDAPTPPSGLVELMRPSSDDSQWVASAAHKKTVKDMSDTGFMEIFNLRTMHSRFMESKLSHRARSAFPVNGPMTYYPGIGMAPYLPPMTPVHPLPAPSSSVIPAGPPMSPVRPFPAPPSSIIPPGPPMTPGRPFPAPPSSIIPPGPWSTPIAPHPSTTDIAPCLSTTVIPSYPSTIPAAPPPSTVPVAPPPSTIPVASHPPATVVPPNASTAAVAPRPPTAAMAPHPPTAAVTPQLATTVPLPIPSTTVVPSHPDTVSVTPLPPTSSIPQHPSLPTQHTSPIQPPKPPAQSPGRSESEQQEQSKEEQLKDDQSTEDQSKESLHWVTYDPNDSSSVYRPRRRTTAAQLEKLEAAYQISHKPSAGEKKRLAMETGMTEREVQIWLQNRRAKDRYKKERPYLPGVDPSTADANVNAEPRMDPSMPKPVSAYSAPPFEPMHYASPPRAVYPKPDSFYTTPVVTGQVPFLYVQPRGDKTPVRSKRKGGTSPEKGEEPAQPASPSLQNSDSRDDTESLEASPVAVKEKAAAKEKAVAKEKTAAQEQAPVQEKAAVQEQEGTDSPPARTSRRMSDSNSTLPKHSPIPFHARRDGFTNWDPSKTANPNDHSPQWGRGMNGSAKKRRNDHSGTEESPKSKKAGPEESPKKRKVGTEGSGPVELVPAGTPKKRKSGTEGSPSVPMPVYPYGPISPYHAAMMATPPNNLPGYTLFPSGPPSHHTPKMYAPGASPRTAAFGYYPQPPVTSPDNWSPTDPHSGKPSTAGGMARPPPHRPDAAAFKTPTKHGPPGHPLILPKPAAVDASKTMKGGHAAPAPTPSASRPADTPKETEPSSSGSVQTPDT
ncbi:hypothetical protein HK104_005334, partial [Borealophlyctis nickersoniae]